MGASEEEDEEEEETTTNIDQKISKSKRISAHLGGSFRRGRRQRRDNDK